MNDVISRQAAIAAIRAVPEGNWSGEKYAQEIMKVPPAQQWIPCSKRLPDEANSYIVTEYSGVVEACAFYDTESSREYWRRFVIAWMPSPEPYKGGVK